MTALDDAVLQHYHGLCILCLSGASCVHHEPPLSLEPEKEEDMYPLCNDCHSGPKGIHAVRADAKERCVAGAAFTIAYLEG